MTRIDLQQWTKKKTKSKKTLAKTKKETKQLKQANNHAFRNSYRFCIKR